MASRVEMDLDQVREAFRAEARALSATMATLSEVEWDRPTRCAPWNVRELLGHIRVAIGWLAGMLAQPPPATADVSAVDYYRPDQRFSAASNATRVDLAREQVG